MNIPLIEIPRSEARAKLRQYRQSLHRRADAEYEAAAKGYKELALGRPLLDMNQVLAAVPVDERNRPRVALARADRIRVSIDCDGPELRFRTRNSWNWRARLADRGLGYDIRFPLNNRERCAEGFAIVPMVPPDVKRHFSLKTTYILWEVEKWADRPLERRPDRDPLLLRHLGGSLYAVLGQWDLTPLEQAIMMGRIGQA